MPVNVSWEPIPPDFQVKQSTSTVKLMPPSMSDHNSPKAPSMHTNGMKAVVRHLQINAIEGMD